MRTKVFFYKGYVGIQSSMEADGIIAKPGNGNIGFVINADHVDVSPEALDALKKVKKVGGSFGSLMIFQANDDVRCFSWLGGPLNAFRPEDVEGDRDYTPSILKPTDDVVVPEEFKQFVDSQAT
jgi:hypothetical protein